MGGTVYGVVFPGKSRSIKVVRCREDSRSWIDDAPKPSTESGANYVHEILELPSTVTVVADGANLYFFGLVASHCYALICRPLYLVVGMHSGYPMISVFLAAFLGSR